MTTPKAQKWLSRKDEATGRELVTLRDGGVCVKCRRIDPVWGVNHDHRKNRSQGGDWAPSNGQLLCGSGTTGCHGWVTSHPAEAVAEGWACPGWADPAEWPARRWLRGDYGTLRLAWVLYDNTGSWREISDCDAGQRMKGSS